jgi:starch-binding outer membrane protein, SusD/RagB family
MRTNTTTLTKLLSICLVASLAGCDLLSPTSLDREPNDILLENQVWNDPKLVMAVLANYYDRLPETHGLGNNHVGFAETDEAIWSGSGNNPNTIANYSYSYASLWDYQLIRDINLFIEKVDESARLSADAKSQFKAEGRFLRAYVYFELVKRMGGVPLITQTYRYQLGDSPAALQFPRATEAQVYEFIGKELDEIKNDLPSSRGHTRANRWTALALKSRAMLYAGSLARYNGQMAQSIQTQGGEVGIPASRAEHFYAQSLAASQELIQSGHYRLYDAKPHRGENFYDAITSKVNNPEVIWARDFSVPGGKLHNFTYNNIPRSLREDNENGSEITPTLNLVEAFEYLDGSDGKLRTRQANGDYVYYDTPDGIFDGKDGRLWGTVIYPGARFRAGAVSIQAGVLVWNAARGAYDEVGSSTLGSNYTDGKLLVGLDGPHVSEPFVTNSGFYLRKYLDPVAGSGQRGRGTDMWWIRFRYAEILLNAAEAALELGQQGTALGYVNHVRQRAGFPANSLSTLTMDRLRNERRVELAFENHRLWDLKRWRQAHEVWDGDRTSPTAQLYALWPYRVVRPGDPRDGTYVFIERVAPRVTVPRFFRLGNYYSAIDDAVITANPALVRNPFH